MVLWGILIVVAMKMLKRFLHSLRKAFVYLVCCLIHGEFASDDALSGEVLEVVSEPVMEGQGKFLLRFVCS